LRSLTAGMLAAALSVAGNAQPVHAAPTDVRPLAVDPYSIIIEIGINLLSHAFSGGGVSQAELAQAVAQITAQIEQTKTDIINHVDAIASAEVQACARTNTIEFASINSMSRTVLQLWAQSATACATRATAYLHALTSPAAVDNIGWLVGEIFTIVIAARTKGGLTEGLDLVRQDEISAFETVVNKLTPDCQTAVWWPGGGPDPDADSYHEYTCKAYTGRQSRFTELYQAGTLVTPPVDLAAMKDEAARGTSWSAAVAALASLRAVVPPR
jgi:hypothetical protein